MNLKKRLQRLEQDRASTTAAATRWEFPDGCICFPVPPYFHSDLERDIAVAMKCPIHGERFSEEDEFSRRIYIAKWLRERGHCLYRVPHQGREQYVKAWRAAFPAGFLPYRSEFVNRQYREVAISIEEYRAAKEAAAP